MRLQSDRARLLLGALGLLVLLLVYLFQRFNLFSALVSLSGIDSRNIHPYVTFVFNKTARLLINDTACFLLIFAIFQQKKYLRVAFYVLLFELLILLPVYFIIKLQVEGDTEISSPLLSQMHRMIVNPTLMILLMIGFYYQRLKEKNNSGR